MSKYSMLCLDASIVVGLATGDISDYLRDEARTWFEHGVRFIAPSFLGFEFTNALYKSVLRGASLDVVAPAFEALRRLEIEMVDCSDLHQEAIAIARRFGMRASYDAHYIALAAKREVELITSDHALYEVTKADLTFIRYIAQPNAR